MRPPRSTATTVTGARCPRSSGGAEMAPRRTPPRVMGGLHSVFWEHCDRSELVLQRCDDCQEYLWPPSPICDACLSTRLTWTPLSGRGTVFAHCVFERQYYDECPPPWPVLLVKLEEGPHFV